MIWLVIELCPQPWHKVDSPPRYSCWVRPIRFTFAGLPLAGLTSVVIAISPVENTGHRVEGTGDMSQWHHSCSVVPVLYPRSCPKIDSVINRALIGRPLQLRAE